ncbi:MAG: hypothetical protein LQ342_002658 [Letrouitia transgressa]|nr:MAG: hypothetical protein LQ342_002658 [Letrouitia transgressa]
MPPHRIIKSTEALLRAGYSTSRPRKPLGRSFNPRSRPPRISPERTRPWAQSAKQSTQEGQPEKQSVSDALRDIKPEDNNLLTPVHVPENPNGVLNERHPSASILANSAIIIQRQLELMNIMIGFEQANKYVIMDPQGNHLGYMAEQDNSLGKSLKRQMFNTHRSFTTHVFDRSAREVLRFYRPFAWISSRIGVYDPVEVVPHMQSQSKDLAMPASGALATQVDPTTAQVSQLPLANMRLIGEAQQQWAPLRRKYNLFSHRASSKQDANPEAPQLASGDLPLSSSRQLQVSNNSPLPGEFNQFAYVDEPFLSWDFSLLSSDSRLIGSVNRNFSGFAREIFTDTGVYVLRMDAAGLAQEPRHLISHTGYNSEVATEKSGMTLDQRAVVLATAVSVDFDYFSRHSGSTGGMGMWPVWLPWGGGAAEGAAAGEAAEGAGALESASEGGVVRGAGEKGVGEVGEGAVAGAGSVAGYEAMQRGFGRGADDASPTPGQGEMPGQNMSGQAQGESEDVWGEDWNPWGGQGGPKDGQGGGGAGEGGGGEDGGILGDLWSGFFEE